MRKIISGILCIVLMLSLSTTAFAAVTGDEVQTYDEPILITNAGQGPGGKMSLLLFQQAGIEAQNVNAADFDPTATLGAYYDSEPVEEDLDASPDGRPYGAMFVVIGSTDKGLGASGITIEDELARLDKMVKHAQEIELPIVAVLLEKDKRQEGVPTNANERCIDAICPYADWMIVVADGNTDGRFDAFKEENGSLLTVLDTTLDFKDLVTQVYGAAE